MSLADETRLPIELQSSNDGDLGLRMLEYYALLWRRYRKPVRFSFTLRDIREWRAAELLASPVFGDQVLAILGGTEDARGVVRGVLERIEKMVPERRARALRYVLNLAGLRKFGIILEQEVEQMGVTVDWSQYTAVREAEVRGVREALVVVLGKQFGPLPAWAQEKIEKASKRQAMAWLVKASDVAELTDLIPRR